jgi:Ricin-type beta-trefoil lectin domain
MMRRILVGLVALTAAVGLGVALPAAAQAVSAGSTATPAAQAAANPTAPTRRACGTPLRADGPVCYALVRTDITPLRANALRPDATPSGYGPGDLQSAYGLPSGSAGSGQTVAVMEAADDPNLESDLATYRSQFGLSACTTANGCFRKVNISGQQGNYPGGDTGWGTEASLDVDMVSAICPKCGIVVVEAGDLNAAQNTAVSLGAHYLSNSWGTGDGSGDSGWDADYNHAGVVDVASTGDGGYGVSFPATSRYVVAAGGTSLNRNSGTSRGWSETAWSGSGAGCSSWETKPTWQTDSGCGRRTDADVSAVADPGTGVAVYDTYGQGGWFVVGGTSASSPIIASTYALAANPPSGQAAASTLYAHPGNLNDVTSGSDGSCSPAYLCTAGSGYDGPTGLGTPNGLAAFGGSGTSGSTGPITGVSGLCVDDRSSSTADFNPIQIWGCNGSSAQQWSVVQAGSTLHVLGKCMDVGNGGTADGSTINLYDCNGSGSQVFQPQSNGSLLNPQSGKCLDDPNSSTTQGTQLQLWDCNGTSAQHWTLP